MMRIFLFAFLFINYANAQSWQWANQITASSNLGKTCMDVDASGNVYVAGVFSDSIHIGTTQLTTNLQAIYLAKYDQSGSFLFARMIAEDSILSLSDINVNSLGKINLTGQFKGNVLFSTNILLQSAGDYDVFIAQADDNDVLWATSSGTIGYDYGSAVSSDSNGNTFISGEYHISPYQFSSSKIFIAKYDALGNSLWQKVSNRFISTDLVEDLQTDSSGSSLITGQLFDTLSFDSVSILAAGNIEANVFVVKFDSNGNISWMQKAGAPSGYCSGMSVAFSTDGGNYLSGFFHGTISLGTLSLTGNFGVANQAFFAKLDPSGNFLHVNKTDGPAQGRKIIASGTNIMSCGYFTDSIHAGNLVLKNNASHAIFILELDSVCNIISGEQIGGRHNVDLGSFVLHNSDKVISGQFIDTVLLGANVLSNAGNKYDAFVASTVNQTGVGENNLSETEITFGPNPVNCNSVYTINSPTFDKFSISVYNACGSLISENKSCKVTPGLNRFNFENEHFPQGIYFLKIRSSQMMKVFRIVKD
jgi:hypothetical protein